MVVAAPAPDHAIARGRAGAGLLAHIVVSKYDDHLPLYRQAEIFARDGVNLETSTLSGWVGATAAALKPLVDALAAEVLTGDTLHVDDTPVPVLAPGTGKTKTGRLWTYVRDERPFAGSRPPAALFFYSPDRKGEHPAFIGRSPDTATAEDLRLFQLHQTQSGMQPPSINSAVSALRFFFTVTLDRPDLARRLTVVPQPRRIPAVSVLRR